MSETKPKMTAEEEHAEMQALQDVATSFRKAVDVKTHKYRMKTYKDVFTGKDAVPALITAGMAEDETEAIALGNRLLLAGIIEHVKREHMFKNEFLFYRFKIDSPLQPMGDRFWNIRGKFQLLMGVIDVGTHMSLIQKENGSFILLDAIPLTEPIKKEIDALTNNGERIAAVLGLHPYHTLAFPALRAAYPQAPFYGTPRHLRVQPELKWTGDLHDEGIRELFAPDILLSIPDGVEFVNPLPARTNHIASILAFHPHSGVVHVDDTLNYWHDPGFVLRKAGCAHGNLNFHSSLTSSGILPAVEAPFQFRDWAQGLLAWEFDTICAAHNGNLVGGAKKKLVALLERTDKKFNEMTEERRVGTKKIKKEKQECPPNTNIDECNCG